MSGRRKTRIAIGAGAAILAGASVFTVISTQQSGERGPEAMAGKNAGAKGEICLTEPLALVEGFDAKCFAPDQIASLFNRPVLDVQGAPVKLRLTPPDDQDGAQDVATCAEYTQKTGAGWYAMTSLDMRKEAFFVRACGVLAMLQAARPAEVSYFEGDALTTREIESLAVSSPFGITERDVKPSPATIAQAGENRWRITFDSQIVDLQEIAHADFNADGRGDILVFVSITAVNGTAQTSRIGYLDKSAPKGPVRFIEWRPPPAT